MGREMEPSLTGEKPYCSGRSTLVGTHLCGMTHLQGCVPLLRHGSTIPMVEHEAVISRVQQQRNDGKCRYRREPCGQRRHVWLAGVVVTQLLVGSRQIPAATASPATLNWASPV